MDQVQPESDLLKSAKDDIANSLIKLTSKSVLCVGVMLKEKDIPSEETISHIIEKFNTFEVISIKPNKQCLALLFDIKTGLSKRLNVTIIEEEPDDDIVDNELNDMIGRSSWSYQK